MKKWWVSIPVTMEISVEVEAETEEEAIEKGLYETEWTLGEPSGCEVINCESHRQVCRGNVFSGVLNEAYAMEAN